MIRNVEAKIRRNIIVIRGNILGTWMTKFDPITLGECTEQNLFNHSWQDLISQEEQVITYRIRTSTKITNIYSTRNS